MIPQGALTVRMSLSVHMVDRDGAEGHCTVTAVPVAQENGMGE